MMVALGLNRLILVNTAVAAAVNLLLSLALVNWLGFSGAALSTVLTTSLVICSWNLLAIRSAIPCRLMEVLPFGRILEIFGLSIAAAFPVVLSQMIIDGTSSLWQVVLGTAIFLVVFLALAKLTNNQLVLAYVAAFERRFKRMISLITDR
jgi:O-antigen/teichoic acid export membrane protein